MKAGGLRRTLSPRASGRVDSRSLPWLRLLILSASMMVVVNSAACRCVCNSAEGKLARVVEVHPVTEISDAGGSWRPAENDDGLGLGDALRTGETGRAVLEVTGQGRVTIGPNSLVRFGSVQAGQARPDGEGEVSLVLETGQLEVETNYEGAPALVIAGPGGSRVRLGQGAHARWVFDDAQQLQLSVQRGSATIEQGDASTELAAGQTLVLGEAEALAVERPQPDAGPRPSPAADAGAADGAADSAADAEAEVEGLLLRGLGRRSLEVRQPGESSFSRARGRVSLQPGAALRVTGREVVTLRGPDGAVVLLRPGARATFRGVGGGRIRVTLSGGAAEGRSTGGGVAALTVPGGAVETVPVGGTSAYVATVRNRRSTHVEVREGMARVTSGDRTERLLTGAETVLGERRLRITRSGEVPPVFMGGSAVVFDPERIGSFTIRFEPIPNCDTYAIRVDHGGRRFLEAVTDRPVLALRNVEYGDYTWRAACVVDGVPQMSDRMGRVARRADSSRAALPTRAPHNTLDTDGRTYTVLYQNRLPALTLRWSKAPEASSYYLEVVEERTGRKIHAGRVSRPRRSFRSGTFRDGRYLWFFRAGGVSKRVTSPITTVRVAYDNVSPTIQIIEPRNGAPASGSVRVRGVAAVGSTVIANGVQLDLGSDFRFDQEVPVRHNMVIFRVTTPRRGTAYYLRHLGGGH